MQLTRREFLKLSGVTTSGLILNSLGLFDFLRPQETYASTLKVKYGKETTTVCPYCGVGCGAIVTVSEARVVNIEGDPDHPINEGSLCSKGSAMLQIANNERRLTKVLYRAPNSQDWQEKDIDWAIKEIAERLKQTRDANFMAKDGDIVVNRTEAIASVGGAALNNEECYLITKLMRAMGVVYLEHEARLCHSSTVAGLGASFGRGVMTNHWIDIKNSDCIFIIGSNPAENHPVAFKWIAKAKEKGAKLIVADPRFTRSASKADLYVRFRPGTDIALIGGLINYCLQNKLYQEDYVKNYANASFLVDPKFGFNDGLFTGYDAKTRSYDTAAWDYQKDKEGKPLRDPTLKDPNCVFQLLKKFYSRYSPKVVEEITGVSPSKLVKMAQLFCSTGKPDKSGTILYAMGATQHTVGTQYIRSYAILQLLLGNIGIAGGGINAMRGESNVQGACDVGVLFHILTGYLGAPKAKDHPNLKSYIEKETPKTSYWSNKPKFLISMLKAFWQDFATKDNDFCYDYLPKMGGGYKGGGYSWIPIFEAMYDGKIKGLIDWGMNPAVSGSNANLETKALEKLDWLVEVQLWDTETASFWKRPDAVPKNIRTEVFLLPAACSYEKEGSLTNSGRWIQWRYKACEAKGEAKSDLWYLDRLYKELKSLYEKETKAIFPQPILQLNWNYGEEPDVWLVAKELNGYTSADKKQLANFTKLADDGSTACGSWIYSGFYPAEGENKAAKRKRDDPTGLGLYPDWSFAWPLNRRIVYNRCSMDMQGNPYDLKRTLIKWEKDKWVNFDVPDFGWKDAKTGEMIPPEKSGAGPFIMLPELCARLFGTKALKEGPFPEHYEPYESPIKNPLSTQQINPAIKIWDADLDKRAEVGSEEFPLIATTFRLTEHWQSGPMTRNLPWLAELMPEMFVEISPQLAKAKGIANGEWVKVVSPRGEVEARACVTARMQALKLNGKVYEVVALPWHYGFCGYVSGGPRKTNYAANLLTANVGDANTMIPEYKVFLCDIRK
jgi:formate dehydrogenase major subunit